MSDRRLARTTERALVAMVAEALWRGILVPEDVLQPALKAYHRLRGEALGPKTRLIEAATRQPRTLGYGDRAWRHPGEALPLRALPGVPRLAAPPKRPVR